MSVNYGVKSRYKIYVMSGDGSVKHETDWSPNMILDAGLGSMLGGANAENLRAVCGTGTTPVSGAQTSLATFKGGSSAVAISFSTVANTTTAPYYVLRKWRWEMAPGVATGNITEVGIAYSAATPTPSSPLFSRALVVDSGGIPTSITVLSDEYLQIEYELYVYQSETSGNFTQTIDGSPVSTAYVCRASNMSLASTQGWNAATAAGIPSADFSSALGTDFVVASSGSIGNVSGTISGTISRLTGTTSAAAIDMVNFTRDVTYNALLGDANISISAMSFRSRQYAFQLSLSPPVVKTNEKLYSITIRYSVSRLP